MHYDKYADPIPLDNARAQVKFWQMDLQQSVSYLNNVERFKKHNIKNYDKFHSIAFKDVKNSEKELLKAQKKLEEAEANE